MEKGHEIFSQERTIHDYERKIQDLERLIGHKEVDIALLKNILTGVSAERKKIILIREYKDEYGLNKVLKILGLAKSSIDSWKKVVEERLCYYNFFRRHSALSNKSPIQYLREKGNITL